MAVTINGSGQVPVRVVSTILTSTFSTTALISSGGAAVTGLSASITPSSSSNRILVIVNLYGQGTSGGTIGFAQCYRNSTLVGAGDPSGSRSGINGRYYLGDNNQYGTMGFCFLDSPATTSTLTYQVNVGTESGSTTYVNRSPSDPNSALGSRASSSITLMEIAYA